MTSHLRASAKSRPRGKKKFGIDWGKVGNSTLLAGSPPSFNRNLRTQSFKPDTKMF